MATLSQLITTTDANNNIGAGASGLASVTGNNNTVLGSGSNVSTASVNATAIGANAAVAVDNAVVLGNDVNVGIGTSSPAYGVHLGATGTNFKPQIYLTASTAPIAGAVTSGDAVISVSTGGVPAFTTNAGTSTFVTSSNISGAATSGTATLAGTTGVVINTTAVTTSSIILITKNIGATVATIANVSSLVVGNVSSGTFTIYSSVSGDLDNVNWMIIN